MTINRPINVALTFTDDYWALAYTVMRSICLSTKERKQVGFHLCHPPLSPDHLTELHRIETEFGASLHHYDPMSNPSFMAAMADLPSNDRFPPIVYARTLLDKILPASVERVIYLDCDTMVRRPIEDLYDIDMAGMTIAAVADPYHDGIKLGRDINTRKSPFDPADRYFNSGVLLLDLQALAREDIPGRIRDLKSQGVLDTIYYDQDLLNLIFLDRWTVLDWRFNVMTPWPAHEAMGPRILHYSGFKRPWTITGKNTAFFRTYRHVMTNRVYYWFWRERLARNLPRPLRGLIRVKPAT